MKTLTALFLLLAASAAFGQTVKTIGFNTTNGEVIANTGTNALTLTNNMSFSAGAASSIRESLAIPFFGELPAGTFVLQGVSNTITLTFSNGVLADVNIQ